MTSGPIGPRLRAARAAAGLSQTQLAARLGVTQQMISKVERADATPPLDTIAAYAAAIGADPATLDDRLARRKGRKRR